MVKKCYLEELKELATACKADIVFAGSQHQVREIYALSDIVVSPASIKPETFGRVAAEAMAMNTPVIASAHGGSRISYLIKPMGIYSHLNNRLN